MTLAWTLCLGFFVGLRHAFEPDHLAAVMTMAERDSGKRAGVTVGAWWGLGHALALLAMALLVSVLGVVISPGLAQILEFIVGVVLVAMGVRSMAAALGQGATGPAQSHQHGILTHIHRHQAKHVHLAGRAFSVAPLLVGLLHGFAGSAAVLAITIGQNELASQFELVASFGVGSLVGMAGLSMLLGHAMVGVRARLAQRWLPLTVGLMSTAIGLVWTVRVILAWPT